MNNNQLVFFESMQDDEYDVYLKKIDPEKFEKIRKRMRSNIYSISPLTCQGPDKCPFLSKCPIPDYDANANIIKGDKKDYPVGKSCIVEKFFIEQKIVNYMQYLNVDSNNPIEISIVEELSLLDLMKHRCLSILSNGDKESAGRDLLLKEITGYNENGAAATSTKIHPLVDLIDKLEKRRERWLEKLMETRKSKADFISKVGSEEGNNKILTEISKLRKALNDVASGDKLDVILLDEK